MQDGKQRKPERGTGKLGHNHYLHLVAALMLRQ
jgi:hypothetical protein